MDPNASLERMLELAQLLRNDRDERIILPSDEIADAKDQLVEYVLALNDWLAQGGSLPKEWSKVAWANGVTLAQAITLGGKVLAGGHDARHDGRRGPRLGLPVRDLHERSVRARDRPRRAGSS
jgi:hypothetical protein